MAKNDDFLAPLPVDDVYKWYSRAADHAGKEKIEGQVPMASTFLNKYLSNRHKNTMVRFTPPNYLRNFKRVLETLKYQREVFLTQKKARIGKKGLQKEIWAGLVPRLQGKSPYQKWDIAKDPKVYMEYSSLVEVGRNSVEIAYIQFRGSKQEKDVFGSLRGFQLRSQVMVTGKLLSPSTAKVHFSFWQCEIIDRYDFKYSEHLSFKNPDYQKHLDSSAISPDKEWVRVYHSNAKRLVDAKLACPYNIQSYSWVIQDPEIVGPAEISF
jgi:hypothetical protein